MKLLNKICLLSVVAASISFASEKDVATQAKSSVMKLGKTLKSQLMQKLKEDGSGVKAITFCSEQAQELTQKVSEELGEKVTVRRAAIKYRNPDNKPTAQDTAVMKEFIARAEKGESFEEMGKMVKTEKGHTFYKALGTGKGCLRCHGAPEAIHPSVLEMIDKQYPGDKARNFKRGEFRGVIVAEIND